MNTKGGLVPSLDDLKNAPGVSDAVIASLKNEFYAGSFTVIGNESVGAVAGSDLRRRALLAIGLSFLGMLVYIGFRFKPIYGVAAILALVHDVADYAGIVCAHPEGNIPDGDRRAADTCRIFRQRHDRDL